MECRIKIPKEDIRTIFFDYDGTLHDSLRIYALAFKKAYAYLVEEGHTEPKEWSDKEISHWLGFIQKICGKALNRI